MAKAWHYAWEGKTEGPVEAAHIADLVRAGRIRPETLIWAEGMANWEEARTHFAFAEAASPTAAAPPPVPGRTDQLYHGAPARSFTEAIKVCFQKYITFSGRASRSEYWWFMLFLTLGSFAGVVLEGAMGSDGQVLSGLFSLATFLPSISVQVRRLHDTNRTGWWVGGFYLALIPFFAVLVLGFGLAESGSDATSAVILLAGAFTLGILGYVIAMLIFALTRGDAGPNRFG